VYIFRFHSRKNRPGCEPNKSRVGSAEVMTLRSKFPSVLRFQLNEQQHLKALRVSVTDSTVNMGLWQFILVQRCWWRLVSFGMWCELLTASSVGLPELWRWRQ